MLLIKNSFLFRDRHLSKLDVLVDDNGNICEISSGMNADVHTVYADNLILSPGFIDCHVHLRDPGYPDKETIESGTRAAIRGGYTTIICMANTNPPCDNKDTLNYILSKTKKSPINILQCCSITKGTLGKELCNFEELMELGTAGFSDDGMSIFDASVCYEAMKLAKKLGVMLSMHEEDRALVYNAGIDAKSRAAENFNLKGAFAEAEHIMIARDIALCLQTGAHVCFQHVSSALSLKLIRIGKQIGANICCEVTPHHLTLTSDAVIKHGTNAKINPPLRGEKDRLALIDGLKDDTIDVIATDHAPHTKDQKSREFTSAPSGIIGLETAFCVLYTHIVKKGHLTLEGILTKITESPARLYNIKNKEIAVGNRLEGVLINLNKQFDSSSFVSMSQNTPYLNERLYGVIENVIMGDKLLN